MGMKIDFHEHEFRFGPAGIWRNYTISGESDSKVWDYYQTNMLIVEVGQFVYPSFLFETPPVEVLNCNPISFLCLRNVR